MHLVEYIHPVNAFLCYRLRKEHLQKRPYLPEKYFAAWMFGQVHIVRGKVKRRAMILPGCYFFSWHKNKMIKPYFNIPYY